MDDTKHFLMRRKKNKKTGKVDFVHVVCSFEEQKNLIMELHSGKGDVRQSQSLEATSMAGHWGRDKMLEEINAHWYFTNITKKVEETIKYCQPCQFVNQANIKDKGRAEMQIIQVPNKVWSKIGVDLIGPLVEVQGMSYIAVTVDYFMKYPMAAALPGKCTLGVADFLYECTTMFGRAEIFITDQGTEFNNQCMKAYTDHCRSLHHNTSAYHPQANGKSHLHNDRFLLGLGGISTSRIQVHHSFTDTSFFLHVPISLMYSFAGVVERMNKTTQNIIKKHVMEKKELWLQSLRGILFAVWSSAAKATGFSPIEMMLGCPPITPCASTKMVPWASP